MILWDQFFKCSDWKVIPSYTNWPMLVAYMGHGLKRRHEFTSKCLKHHTPCRNASDEELDVAFALTHLDTWYTSKGILFSIALGWKYDAIFASNSHNEPSMCYGYPLPTILRKAKSKVPCGFRVTSNDGDRGGSWPNKAGRTENRHVQRPLLWMLHWIRKFGGVMRNYAAWVSYSSLQRFCTVDPKTFRMESSWIGFFDEQCRFGNHEAVPKNIQYTLSFTPLLK